MCLDVYKHRFSSEMPATHVSSGPADQWHLGSRKFAAPAVAEQREKGKVLAGNGERGWSGEGGALSEVPTFLSLLEFQSPALTLIPGSP